MVVHLPGAFWVFMLYVFTSQSVSPLLNPHAKPNQANQLVCLVYTPPEQRGITRIDFGSGLVYVSSRTCLAGLSVLLHKAKCILIYSRVLHGVRGGLVLALVT